MYLCMYIWCHNYYICVYTRNSILTPFFFLFDDELKNIGEFLYALSSISQSFHELIISQ